MNNWLIEPRDPIIVRDGRPFTVAPGARAYSLPFPNPQTLVGVLRTREGKEAGLSFSPATIDQLLQRELRGALLVAVKPFAFYFPAPADAVTVQEADKDRYVHRLAPAKLTNGDQTNLPEELLPAALLHPFKGKPERTAFWHQNYFIHWLEAPSQEPMQLNEADYLNALPQDTRSHVQIDPNSSTAEEGRLFQTNALVFTHGKALPDSERLAMFVTSDAAIKPGIYPLGGERRLCYWTETAQAFPKCPEEIRASIKKHQACRLVLLTPAFFAKGSLPTWLCQTHHGITARVVSIVNGRPEVVSGWNMAKGTAKPSRRLCPAGSVFFLQLTVHGNADVDKWIDTMWFHNVSDDPASDDPILNHLPQLRNPGQNRRDGLGLAALGTWSGETISLEVEK